MYDFLSDNTRVVNIPGTDTILQLVYKKDRTRILALSKHELLNSPDSWKNPVISGILMYSTLFIWLSFISPASFPLFLLCSPIWILTIIIGMKGLNNFLLTDPIQEEASFEDDRDFKSVKNFPKVSLDRNLLMLPDREIINLYKDEVFNSKKNEEKSYINDRTFSELFNTSEKDETVMVVEEEIHEEIRRNN